jgi:hypothetical protein
MKLTRKKAKEESIKKWEALVNDPISIHSDGKFTKFLIDLKLNQYRGGCPLCELFGFFYHRCLGCPLAAANNRCIDTNSYFSKYEESNAANESFDRKIYAEKILNIIKNWEV